jgi:hypothetical protein
VSLRDLAILYLIAGLASAVAIYRTSAETGPRAVAAAALAVPLWPLWAPIALTSSQRSGAVSRAFNVDLGRAGAVAAAADAAARVQRALREGVEASAGTSYEVLLSRDAAARIDAEVTRAAARHAELDALLRREGFDLAAASSRVGDLERSGASLRAIATARLHLENVRRLHAMRERDARALDELADLVQALRTQLVLARFAGSSVEGVGGIVSEVWARVEGLGAAMDANDESETSETSDAGDGAHAKGSADARDRAVA